MSNAVGRPGTGEYSPFYGRYIEILPDDDILGMLESQMRSTGELLGRVTEDGGEHRYAPGKWSVKEVVGHLSDTERVMSYRALRIARGDRTPLAGFDENAYVAGANFSARTLVDLAGELEAVRRSSLLLFGSLGEEAWTREGRANDAAVTVRALAFIIAGHELHHRKLLETAYGLGG